MDFPLLHKQRFCRYLSILWMHYWEVSENTAICVSLLKKAAGNDF